MAVGPWLLYGAQVLGDTLVSSFAGLKGDPLVSYGFKQMYADAKDRDNVTDQLPASPRLTILTTLTQQLQQLSSEGKTVRSITVTGHSLGGALASLCAYDLSTTVAAALEAAKDPKESNEYKELQAKPDLYSQTAAQRLELMSALWHIKQRGPETVPLVAGITFAAPRVGNAAYANAFKARSLIDPLAVREPLFNAGGYHSSALSWLGSVFRDRPWLLMKHMWFRAGTADMEKDAASRAAEQLLQKKTDAAAAPVVGGMLRLVNVHDVAPDVPSAVRVPFFRYVHGGQELLFNSLAVPYYRAGQFTGAAIGARHNLEQNLHSMDPTRPQALVNKSDDVLLSSYCVPKCWWSPVPNRGMVCADVNGKSVWLRKELLGDLPGQQQQQ